MASRSYSLVAVCGLLTVVASLVAGQVLEHLRASVAVACGRSDCSSQTQAPRTDSGCGAGAWLLHSTWEILTSGIEPLFSTLASRFRTTEPSRKSRDPLFFPETRALQITKHSSPASQGQSALRVSECACGVSLIDSCSSLDLHCRSQANPVLFPIIN